MTKTLEQMRQEGVKAMTRAQITAEQDRYDLREALIGALEYIDALPRDVVARLPAMPGFGRDDVDELLERTK